NVLLRNDGHGEFDEVSASVGLDLDQDGRSFAVFDYDLDGRPDVVLLAPRSSPQLRLFRNELASGNAALALRLTGVKSNRDAVGARVTVETEQLRVTRTVQIGSGFLSQHSKELLFGLGRSQSIRAVTIAWPSGVTQTVSGLVPNERAWIEEGRDPVRTEPFRKGSLTPGGAVQAVSAPSSGATVSSGTWLYEPSPAPDFAVRDLAGEDVSLASLAGRPAILLFWATWAPPCRAALEELSRQRAA